MKIIILLVILGSVISGTLSIRHQIPITGAEERLQSENLETVKELLGRQNWWLIRHDTVSEFKNGKGKNLTFIISPSTADQFCPPKSALASLDQFFPQGPKSIPSLSVQFSRAWRGKFPQVQFESTKIEPHISNKHPRVCCDKLRMRFIDPLP